MSMGSATPFQNPSRSNSCVFGWYRVRTIFPAFQSSLGIRILLVLMPSLHSISEPNLRPTASRATCVSIGRIWAISKIDFHDPTYSEWQSLLFTAIEPSLGIWIACVPHLRIFFSGKADKLDTTPIRSDYELASHSLQPRRTDEASDTVVLKAPESSTDIGLWSTTCCLQ